MGPGVDYLPGFAGDGPTAYNSELFSETGNGAPVSMRRTRRFALASRIVSRVPVASHVCADPIPNAITRERVMAEQIKEERPPSL